MIALKPVCNTSHSSSVTFIPLCATQTTLEDSCSPQIYLYMLSWVVIALTKQEMTQNVFIMIFIDGDIVLTFVITQNV